jgi:hypothetical protein
MQTADIPTRAAAGRSGDLFELVFFIDGNLQTVTAAKVTFAHEIRNTEQVVLTGCLM